MKGKFHPYPTHGPTAAFMQPHGERLATKAIQLKANHAKNKPPPKKKKKKQNLFLEESVNYSSSPHMPILTDAKDKNAGLRERKRKQEGLHVSASAQAEYEG